MQAAPRSVLITGANRGIGLEFVRQFLGLPSPPHHLFATCRNLEKAKDLQDIAQGNPVVKILEFDVNNYDALGGLVDSVTKHVGEDGLNMLINNAGAIVRCTLDTVTPEDMMEVFKTNTIAPLMISKAFLPLLRRAAAIQKGSTLKYDRAVIVNVTSELGSIGDNASGAQYNYRASKAALNMVTRSLAIDLKSDGILAIAVHPGWVLTDMGGENALINKETSVTGLLNLFANASEEHAGYVYDFKGNQIEY